MKTKHITTHSIGEAWSVAADLFPTDYAKDTQRSSRAGYDVYHSTADGVSAWISDLGSRLEVNLPNGDTVNVWIEEDGEIAEEELNAALAEEAEEELSAEQIAEQIEARKAAERLHVEAIYTPTVCQEVTVCIMGGYLARSEDERKVYDALLRGDTCIEHEVITAYAVQHGIRWGKIGGVKKTHIEHGSSESGHFIVTGYISASIGEEIDFLAKCADILNKTHEEHREPKSKYEAKIRELKRNGESVKNLVVWVYDLWQEREIDEDEENYLYGIADPHGEFNEPATAWHYDETIPYPNPLL